MMQTRNADRIMAGQNHAERKTGGQFSMILSGHDSVVSGCGYAALCSFPFRFEAGCWMFKARRLPRWPIPRAAPQEPRQPHPKPR